MVERGLVCVWGGGRETKLTVADSLWGRSWAVWRVKLRALGFILWAAGALILPRCCLCALHVSAPLSQIYFEDS